MNQYDWVQYNWKLLIFIYVCELLFLFLKSEIFSVTTKHKKWNLFHMIYNSLNNFIIK